MPSRASVVSERGRIRKNVLVALINNYYYSSVFVRLILSNKRRKLYSGTRSVYYSSVRVILSCCWCQREHMVAEDLKFHVSLSYNLLAHLVAKNYPVLSNWKKFCRLSSILSGQPLTVKLYYLLSGVCTRGLNVGRGGDRDPGEFGPN